MRHGGHHRAVLAGVDGVDLQRRLGAVALVVLGARARVRRARADSGQHLVARQEPGPRLALGLSGRGDAREQLLAQAPVGAGDHGREHRVQRVQGVEGAAAVDAGVQVALGGAHLRCSMTSPRSPMVIAGVRSSTIPESKTIAQSAPRSSARTQCATAVAAGLLLALHEHAHVDRQGARRGLRARDVQQRQEVALVVGRAARVDAAIAHVGLEGRRRPCRRVADRLHVVVAVDQHRRRVLARGAQLADRQRVALGRHHAPLAPDGGQALHHPGGGALEVGGLAAAGRDGRDPQPVQEVVEQALVHARHPNGWFRRIPPGGRGISHLNRAWIAGPVDILLPACRAVTSTRFRRTAKSSHAASGSSA